MAINKVSAEDVRQRWNTSGSPSSTPQLLRPSLIPTHPSAPMFTNSGMMQFVTYFLGEEKAPFDPARATTVQKCVRAGGKHNDLDAIGRSLRHLSFFEMLGNFSFGDYFKHDAITWAWEFVTRELGSTRTASGSPSTSTTTRRPGSGTTSSGYPPNASSGSARTTSGRWARPAPAARAPSCSTTSARSYGPDGGPANPDAESRYVEFWNLVFTQFFRTATGELTPLVNKCVDTGAGLERIVGLLRGSPSLYTCDTLSVLVGKAEQITGRHLGDDPQTDVALRLLADHARSMTFLIADGVIPSNEDRGYVLRRIIRRAVRFAYLLGVSERSRRPWPPT